MTTGTIIALAAVAAAWVLFTEIRIASIRRNLTREIIMRKSMERINRRHIKGLWEDIRAAGITRFRKEEESDGDI